MDKAEALAQLKDAIVVESLQENLTSGHIDSKHQYDSMLETLSWYMCHAEFEQFKSTLEPDFDEPSCDDCTECDWASVKKAVDEFETKQETRFSLEEEIMACWQVVDDLKLLTRQSDNIDDFRSLAVLYEHKFNELWSTFEDMISNGKI